MRVHLKVGQMGMLVVCLISEDFLSLSYSQCTFSWTEFWRDFFPDSSIDTLGISDV